MKRLEFIPKPIGGPIQPPGGAQPRPARFADAFPRIFNCLVFGRHLASSTAGGEVKAMKKTLIASALLAGALLFGQTAFGQVSFGISIGAPPPPPRAYYNRPPLPGPGYVWVDGFWYPNGGRYAWRPGYWALPPRTGGYWIAPRYQGGRYYNGYWGFRGGDRDRDGVPNRYDNFDNRRGGGFDRDRDGVPDRYERRR